MVVGAGGATTGAQSSSQAWPTVGYDSTFSNGATIVVKGGGGGQAGANNAAAGQYTGDGGGNGGIGAF